FSANVLGGLNAATPPLLVAVLLTYFFALKFFFAPLVDKIPAPYFGKKFGHRRGVAMLVQILLIISLVLMSVFRQVPGLVSLSAAALVVIFSGLQILSFEALRVEMLPNNKQGHGVAMSIIGYFLLTLFVGLVGPAISNVGIDFILVFCVLQLLGILALVLAKSPDGKKEPFAWGSLITPFTDFFARHGQWKWVSIIFFILLYKYGSTFTALLAPNFYNGLGFTGDDQVKAAVASIQTVGSLMGLIGLLVGAIVLYWRGLYTTLLGGIILTMVVPIFFATMLRFGANLWFLRLTVSVASLAVSITTIALLAYIASLINRKHTVTQWAWLTSLAAMTSLSSMTVVPTITILPLFIQSLVVLPTSWTLQALKISSPDIIALFMVAMSLPGLLILLSLKKSISK
ncbi:MAG: hypothetical protein ORN57_04735, partial [Alphaproteobacteria bacterium]|nr:hypothetical protein [Alphaproteobacteria bacterium]